MEKVSDETPHLDPNAAKNSILLVCWCPISVSQGDVEIWRNPVPNSTAYARPVALIRNKEERSVLEGEVPNWTPYLKEYEGEACVNGHTVKVKYSNNWSMVDGKMVELLQGDSGAFCHLCTTNRSSGNDIGVIEDGFSIEKDYNTCLEIWKRIESGEIAYSNTAGRQGQCHSPIIQTPLMFFSLLHFKLRSLDFCLKILYHLVAELRDWTENRLVTVDQLLRGSSLLL